MDEVYGAQLNMEKIPHKDSDKLLDELEVSSSSGNESGESEEENSDSGKEGNEEISGNEIDYYLGSANDSDSGEDDIESDKEQDEKKDLEEVEDNMKFVQDLACLEKGGEGEYKHVVYKDLDTSKEPKTSLSNQVNDLITRTVQGTFSNEVKKSKNVKKIKPELGNKAKLIDLAIADNTLKVSKPDKEVQFLEQTKISVQNGQIKYKKLHAKNEKINHAEYEKDRPSEKKRKRN